MVYYYFTLNSMKRFGKKSFKDYLETKRKIPFKISGKEKRMHMNSEHPSLSGKGCNFLHHVNTEWKKGAAKEIRVINCKT